MLLQGCPELHHQDVEHVSNQPDDSRAAEATLGSTIVLVVSLIMDEAGLQQVQAMLREVRPCCNATCPDSFEHGHMWHMT